MKDYQLFLLIFTIVLSTLLIIKKGLTIVNNKYVVMQKTEIPKVIDKKYHIFTVLLLILIAIILIVR